MGICYCFVLTLLRWFQNINFLFRESQLPSLSSFASLLLSSQPSSLQALSSKQALAFLPPARGSHLGLVYLLP